MNIEQVSPIDLEVGDFVSTHGAVVEIMHITIAPCDIPGGVRVAACTSRLVGDDMGSIPRVYFDNPESMVRRGCPWAADLPDGLYWNVQGNAHARISKIVA